MKIGIMGASFDPPHKAHIAIASAAFEALDLDKIIFVPAFSAPLKQNPHHAPFEARLHMLELALENFPHPYEISQFEKEKGGVSYSIDTAAEISRKNPEAELYWIIGTDQLLQLHKWKDIETLGKIVSFAVFSRPGFAFNIPETLPSNMRISEIPFAPMGISSSQIRSSFKYPQMRLDLTDAKVLNYIKENKLYNHV
jgi:nicotinate-nucleotide adenylyltransferase